MRKISAVLIVMISIALMFTGCSNDLTVGILNSSRNKNRQIDVTTILGREIPSSRMSYYNYSKTNGKMALDKIYYFNSSPNDIGEENYENAFTKKYEYRYLNGDRNASINVRRFMRNNEGDEPKYNAMYYFICGESYTDLLEGYRSYDVGSNGSIWSDEFINYIYDENKRLSEYTDDRNASYYFKYDDDGLLTARSYDSLDYDYSYSNFMIEKNDKGKPVTVKRYNEPDFNNCKYLFTYEYDEKTNNLKSETKYYIDKENKENKRYHAEFLYNENGSVSEIREEKYSKEKEGFINSIKSYEYDENQNVSQITIEDDGEYEFVVFEYTANPAAYTDEEF